MALSNLGTRSKTTIGAVATGSDRTPRGRRPKTAAAAMNGVRRPSFLIIGAARSGTTTLHYSLGQHPEIFVSPIKETNFFLIDENGRFPPWVDEPTRQRTPKTLDEYTALFSHATERHRAIGESSPGYLHGPVAPRIKAQLPDAKLIAILRQPVDQAFSVFTTWHGGSLSDGCVVDRFVDALGSSAPGRHGALPLAIHGQYHRHLEPYFELFARGQIKVVLLDHLERDGAVLFGELFNFLGVDDGFRLDEIERYNQTGAAKSEAVHRVLSESAGLKQLARRLLPEAAIRRLSQWQHRVRNANLRRESILSPELRRELTERYYAADMEALGKLIRRDLSIWYDAPRSARAVSPPGLAASTA
jgi:hypothetical protein